MQLVSVMVSETNCLVMEPGLSLVKALYIVLHFSMTSSHKMDGDVAHFTGRSFSSDCNCVLVSRVCGSPKSAWRGKWGDSDDDDDDDDD